MSSIATEPIDQDWTTSDDLPTQPTLCARIEAGPGAPASARAVNAVLARFEVAEIGEAVVPYLAAAAAELALVTKVPWRFSADDPPVALLRMIAKAAMLDPSAGGPHTIRLMARLTAPG